MTERNYDVAIIGGGPAGLQAALILSRLRKDVIVFDSPEPPRNAASHGVHNFVGLDGLLPSEIRERAWQQIDVYDSAELCYEQVIDVQPDHDNHFLVTGAQGTKITAQHVILAIGFRNVYPDIPGFKDCWGDTIIQCPFCDGYENRDRVWGLVLTSQQALDHLPKMIGNWTPHAKIILSSAVTLTDDDRAKLTAQGIPIHQGDVTEVHHTSGKVTAVTLDTEEKVEVGTLLWEIALETLPLTQTIITNFDLELDENGHIKTDAMNQSSVSGLWAVGDVLQGQPTSLGAAYAGSQAAYGIVRSWVMEHAD